jgi:predicted RNA methylase
MAIAFRNQNLDKNPNLKDSKKPWNQDIDFPKNNNISNDINTILVGDLFIWKGIALSQDYLRTINEDQRDEINKDILNYLLQYNFSKLSFAKKDIKTSWESLCKIDTPIDLIDGVKHITNSSSSGNKVYRHYFPNILKVRGDKRASIYDVLSNKDSLWKVIRNRSGNTLLYNDDPKGIPVQYPMPMNISQITIGAKNSGLSSMASIFKPSVAKAIYKTYVKPGDKVLDYSCGFGTRLLGLMSLKNNNLYCGYEPNTETYDNLLKMSKDYNFNVEIKCSGSETGDLFNHEFDFVFSSPPFFTAELYVLEETQSVIKFPEYSSWIESYWRQTVKNCKQMMKKDAIFGINIGSEANELMSKLKTDMTNIVLEENFELIDTWYMKTSKSHLSGKKGDTSKKVKLEGIYFYRMK